MKMKNMIRATLLSMTLAAFSNAALADTVQLRSGAILVGDVELEADGNLIVTTRFPEKDTIHLRRNELVPRSLYDVLDRRTDMKDVKARLELGELAATSGLYGLAVSDFLKVAELDPKQAKQMQERIGVVRESIALEILDDAKALLEKGQATGAMMYLHTIQERYGKTKAAKQAKKLMVTAAEQAGGSADVAKKTISAKKAPKLIIAIEKVLEKGNKEARKLKGHEGDSTRDRRAAERAVEYYEDAWEKIKTLPVAVEEVSLRNDIAHLRKIGKQKLGKAYLTAGSVHLQRLSIPRAEDFCNKACELQPEDKSSHGLHALILQAKINNGGYGWIGR